MTKGSIPHDLNAPPFAQDISPLQVPVHCPQHLLLKRGDDAGVLFALPEQLTQPAQRSLLALDAILHTRLIWF